MQPWSDPAFPQVLESDFYKNRVGHSAAVNATAGERSGVVELLEVTESGFPLVLLVLLHLLVFASVHRSLRILLLLYMRMPQPCTMHIIQVQLHSVDSLRKRSAKNKDEESTATSGERMDNHEHRRNGKKNIPPESIAQQGESTAKP